MDRRDKLLADLDLATNTGVEIGPLYRPLVAKSDGKIIYVDHADTKALRKKYEDDPAVNIEEIVEVDAVWGRQVLQACLKDEKVDYVIASHVIEHVPDLITWLEEIEAVLKPGGSLRLVVPDRRFTFDYLRRESRLCDIVNAYLLKARTPLPIAILDYVTLVRQVDVHAAWDGTLPAELPLVPGHVLEAAIRLARDQIANGSYHDVHCWVFTPRSFANLFAEAAAEGLIRYACKVLHDTEPDQLEFVAIIEPCANRDRIIDTWRRAAAAVKDFQPAQQSDPSAGLPFDRSLCDEIQSLKLSLAEREERLLKVEETLAAVVNSRSWKLTGPLRTLRQAFRFSQRDPLRPSVIRRRKPSTMGE
jgi:SAM-dependent methyltransferase